MPRGPKPKTAKNSRQRARALPVSQYPAPTSELTAVALVEFQRLCRALDGKGMLDRADVGVITKAASTKALLDRANEDLIDQPMDADKVRMITSLDAKYLAYLRALSLTLFPSRSVVKTVAKNPDAADPIKGFIKLA
jgi:hypothetical protein